MSRYDHINFRPPQGARAAAKRALDVRAEKPESQRGMTPVGLARARDLVNGKALSPETVRRMLAFFTRHEVDKKSSTWDEQGKGWQAWHGWGGDAGYAWARKVVRQMDAADEEDRASSETEPHAMDDTSPDDGDDMDEAEFAEHGAVVVPYRAYPVTDAEVWDADAAVQRLRKWAGVDDDAPPESAWRAYAQGFALVRGPADRLGSYLLPHHDVRNGKLVTSPAGVSAAVAALNGARGGVDVPDAVRVGALAHLERHQKAVEDAREATDVHGASEVITCRDAARVGHRTWNQIARYGEFRAHPQGPFRFSAREFREIVANFRALKNGRVPVDYEHTSERHPENVAQQGVPAVAWVVALDDRGDAGLWAEFEWVDPRAVEYVRSGQYLYLSPAVQFASRDKETNTERGARLTSVALTNHPFLDGMAPVTASATAPAAPSVALPEPTRLGLAPGAVHIPTGVTAPAKESRKMDPDNTEMSTSAEGAEMAALKKKMSDTEAQCAAMAEASKAMRARLARMADMDPETAEDDALAKIEALIGEMRAVQKREAEGIASERAASYGMSEKALPRMVALYLSDRAGFEEMWPKKEPPPAPVVETKPAAVNLSETAAPAAQPKPGTGAHDILASELLPGRQHAQPAGDVSSTAAASQEREALATKLMSERPNLTYTEAAILADRTLTEQRRKVAVSAHVG